MVRIYIKACNRTRALGYQKWFSIVVILCKFLNICTLPVETWHAASHGMSFAHQKFLSLKNVKMMYVAIVIPIAYSKFISQQKIKLDFTQFQA